MSADLYDTLCNSSVDYVKFVKEYIKCNDKVKKLKDLELNIDITQSEKLLMYMFIIKTYKHKLFFIRKCNKCNIEWFSTCKDATLCQSCRPSNEN